MLILHSFTMAGQKKLLALYKSNENATAADNPVLYHLEGELKALGYEVDYKDALSVLPSSDEMKQYEGVITFYFTAIHPHAEEYITWLSKQIKEGRKVVIFGNFGAHSYDGIKWLNNEELNDFFLLLGLEFKGSDKINRDDVEVLYRDPSVVNSLPSPFPEYFTLFDSINKNNKSYLTIALKGQTERESCAVIRTPYGGMAQIGYIYSIDESSGNIIWHLNRKDFLYDVLIYENPDKLTHKKMLALYKGSEKQSDRENFIKKLASVELFKLGYKLDYYDIDKGIPDSSVMEEYKGIISWYGTSEMYNAAKYCEWLGDQVSAGKKVVILGDFGAYAEKIKKDSRYIVRYLSEIEINNFFYPFGLVMKQQWTDRSDMIECDYISEEFLNKEMLSKEEDFKNYFLFKSHMPENKSFLTLSRKDRKGSKSDVVVVTPYGGMALQGYIYRQRQDNWEINFILKLDKFFEEALREYEFIPPEIYNITVDKEKELERAIMNKRKEKNPLPCPLPLPRKVLALYKSSEVIDFETSSACDCCDIILNHLGLVCDYVDIESDRPDDETMKDYMAIMTWFTDTDMKGADNYNLWLLKQINNGKKIIILDNYGAFYDKESLKFSSHVKEVFSRLGLECDENYFYILESLKDLKNSLVTHRINEMNVSAYGYSGNIFNRGRPDVYKAFYHPGKIVYIKDSLFGFESPLNIDDSATINPLRSVKEENKILLNIYNSENGNISPVVTGPWGGIISGDFFYSQNTQASPENYGELLNLKYDARAILDQESGRWVINPFDFFQDALDLKEMPKLDYTTLNGQRIFYSHVDADGLMNVSYDEPGIYAGEIVTEHIFEKYNLPVSSSVITDEIVKNGVKYYNPAMDMARHIFALDNIEVASHTHSHPFNLVSGDVKIDMSGDTGNYKISYEKASPETEILYSTSLINQNLVPEGKVNEIIFWPGMCNPSEEFLLETEKLGLANINGGDPIYDKEYDSYSSLCPVLIKQGKGLQVHTSGSNDYIYTKSWTGNYNGMIKLLDHIERTDKPVRISPVNIYYHFYSGIYKESLEALQKLYEYCLSKDMALLFASQYSRIIKDFYYATTGRTGDGGFIIRNMGYLRTVRFDNTSLYPDLELSEHILGFNYYNNSLYIFLDEREEHKIYLTDKCQSKVYLKSASHYIALWESDGNGIRAVIQDGIGPGYMEIANLKEFTLYKVKLGDFEQDVKTDREGLLAFRYELKGRPKTYILEAGIKK